MWWPIFSLYFVTAIHLVRADGCEDPKPDFSAPGRRVSDEKCQEYNWERIRLDKCSKDAANIDYPYLGTLAYDTGDDVKFRCGALLVSPKFALTAAHCINVPAGLPSASFIRFGNKNLSDKEPHVDVKILSSTVHPEYQPETSRVNDIALVEFESELPFSKSIYPACLWNKDSYDGADNIFSAGWARKKNGQQAYPLSEVKITVMEPEKCMERLQKYYKYPLTDRRICVNETYAGGCDTLPSTSPMITRVKLDGSTEGPMPFAIGMASFGELCGNVAIYSRVYSYIDWIEQIVWK